MKTRQAVLAGRSIAYFEATKSPLVIMLKGKIRFYCKRTRAIAHTITNRDNLSQSSHGSYKIDSQNGFGALLGTNLKHTIFTR